MKKLFLLIALVMAGVAGTVHSATNTPTNTPTFTATPTFTPTPVIRVESGVVSSVWIAPNQLLQGDGVTPLTFETLPWLAQSASKTCAVIAATATGQVRFTAFLPNDYAGNLKVYALVSTTNTVASTSTITVTMNVRRDSPGRVSWTASTVYPGAATEASTIMPGFQGSANRIVKALLPISNTAKFNPGDIVSGDLNTSASQLNVSVYGIELQYKSMPTRQR
jgi:hypothetical protein